MADDNDSDDNENSGPTEQEKARKRLKETLTFPVVTVIAAVSTITLLAVVNGVFGGPDILGGFLGFFGFQIPGVISGPARALLIIVVIILLSLIPELFGLKTTAPFWIGLALLALIISKYVLPDFVTGAFTFLHLGELIFGIPLAEMDVLRTTVLGFTFIAAYYATRNRIKGALGMQGGSKKVGGVMWAIRDGFNQLFRKYKTILYRIAGTLGIIGFITVVGAGTAFGNLANELGQIVLDFPVWTGYIGTLVTWLANSSAATLSWVPWIGPFLSTLDLPVTFSDAELALLFLFILGVTILLYTRD